MAPLGERTSGELALRAPGSLVAGLDRLMREWKGRVRTGTDWDRGA